MAEQIEELSALLDAKKTERKGLKREIQAWLKAFKAENGREATIADKQGPDIKPLYVQYRALEAEQKQLAKRVEELRPPPKEVSTSPPDTAKDTTVAKEELQVKATEAASAEETKGVQPAAEIEVHTEASAAVQNGVDESNAVTPSQEEPRAVAVLERTPTLTRQKSVGRRVSSLVMEKEEEEEEEDDNESQSASATREAAIRAELDAIEVPKNVTGAPAPISRAATVSTIRKPSTGAPRTRRRRAMSSVERIIADASWDSADKATRKPRRGAELAQDFRALTESIAMEEKLTEETLKEIRTPVAGAAPRRRPSSRSWGLQQHDDEKAADSEKALLEAIDAPVKPPPPPKDVMRKLDNLRSEMKAAGEAAANATVDTLVSKVEQQKFTVASVPLSTVHARERELEEQRIRRAEREAYQYQVREADLSWRENRARCRVHEREKAILAQLDERRKAYYRDILARERTIDMQFRRAREHLEAALEAQHATVLEKHGVLEMHEQPGARRSRVSWDQVPQPVEVHIHMARAVKDKLPRGRYAVLISVYDRLGGSELRWTRGVGLDDDQVGVTKPVRHSGYHYSREMRFAQSVFTLVPARKNLRPSTLLLFELFLLAGPKQSVDQVVGWGALPAADYRFNVVRGRFKIPLLRGEHSFHTIDKFRTMDRMLQSDLNHWLCNLYFEVRHLPRVTEADHFGARGGDFDLELNHVTKTLKMASREEQRRLREREARAARARDMGLDQDEDVSSDDESEGQRRSRKWWEKKHEIFHVETPEVHGPDDEKKSSSKRSLLSFRRNARTAPMPPSMMEESSEEKKLEDIEAPKNSLLVTHEEIEELGYDSEEEPYLALEEKSRVCGAGDTSRETGLRRRRGDGTRYDDQGLGIADGIPSHQAIAPHQKQLVWTKLTDPKEMELFTPAVAPEPGKAASENPDIIMRSKLRYIRQEILADLAVSNWRSQEFWLTLWVYLMALWFRMYVHFVAQYLFLMSLRVPVYNFGPRLHQMTLKYIMSSINVRAEIGVLLMGPMGVLSIMICFMAVGRMWQKLLGHFPDWASKFCAAYGVGCVLDPVLILLIDLLAQNFDCTSRPECEDDYTASECDCFQGDFFKLYARMEETSGSGVSGIIVTAMLYTFTMVLAAFVLYNYLLYIHFNGRMLDVHRRLHLHAGEIFVPHDFEMSLKELEHICRRAKKWQGPHGEQKRVVVTSYDITDPRVAGFSETVTHIAIFIYKLDGGRKLWRHFLRSPEGAVIEVFDENLSSTFGTQFENLEGLLRQDVEQADDSQRRGHFARLDREIRSG